MTGAGKMLAVLADTHPVVRKIFTEGGCFELYRALRFIDPGAVPFYGNEGHVYTKLSNGKFYDINGEYSTCPDKTAVPMSAEKLSSAHRWKNSIKLIKTECN